MSKFPETDKEAAERHREYAIELYKYARNIMSIETPGGVASAFAMAAGMALADAEGSLENPDRLLAGIDMIANLILVTIIEEVAKQAATKDMK